MTCVNDQAAASRVPSPPCAGSLGRTLLLVLAGAAASPAVAQPVSNVATRPTDASPKPISVEQITVTSTRRKTSLLKTPANVTAYSQKALDVRSIRQIPDLARLTPDLTYTQTTGSGGNNAANIAIRGIYSDVGASTTGIYIDDTPIQTRNIGYFSSNTFPKLFDLQQVEILRGPQGTLFGASSEGGNVRFLTPQPNLTAASGYMRTEVSQTENGDPSYEGGIAYGAPLIDNQLAFRFSVWGRRDGGYIDRVDPITGVKLANNVNSEDSTAGKFDLTWSPTPGLTITPGVFYQDVYDRDRQQYWADLSHPYADQFATGEKTPQPADDHFVLPTLRIRWDLPDFSIISNTSYFNRKQAETLDYTNYLSELFTQDPFAFEDDAPSTSFLTIRQHNFTQELRIESNHPADRLTWVAGVFYAHNIQAENNYTTSGFQPPSELLDGRFSFVNQIDAVDQQMAGFLDMDYKITPRLTASAGVRVSNDSFDYTSAGDGPENGGPSIARGGESELPVTPRFNISYQLDPNNFAYFTAAEGFRQGGAQSSVPESACARDLAGLGLSSSPTTYNSDNLWSYELGLKDFLLGGRVTLDSSVYHIDWNNIQQDVRLPTCGFAFVDNLGSATANGGDISATLMVTDSLSAGANVGYVDVLADDTIGTSAILVRKGDRIGGPPLTSSFWLQQDFRIRNHQAFVRADYSFRSHSPSVDALVFNYDPSIPSLKANGVLSLRAGIRLSGWELEAFADNVTNEETPIAIADDLSGSPILYQQSYRPLTVGLDLERRF